MITKEEFDTLIPRQLIKITTSKTNKTFVLMVVLPTIVSWTEPAITQEEFMNSGLSITEIPTKTSSVEGYDVLLDEKECKCWRHNDHLIVDHMAFLLKDIVVV